MPKTVSSSEAQNNFGAMLQWAEENQEEVVVERRGKPAGVLIGYEQYQEYQRLKAQERKRKAWEALEALRKKVAARNADLTPEEAYRLAGFSEEVIQETLESDRELAQRG
ncbi:MAG TPA: type II toxin-antitoxin system prevent-host-death family antitoxin [Caldilineaceae bacterium]|nr:type II toxin-antitoxin system prevent-host-death family antitoxin [Caldilineaceae bacterium]